MMRFVLNVAMYAVFGGGLFAFAAMRSGRPVAYGEVLGAVALVALWSGGITSAIERWVPRLPAMSSRVLAGAALGALSLGGFALALSWVVWRAPVPALVALATLAGAIMQGARTFAARPPGPGFHGEPVNAKQLIAQGAVVIDVRNQDEWDAGHLPMARLLPLAQLPARLREVEEWVGPDKSRAVIVYCRSGARSGRAKEILDAAGYANVTNGGGFSDLR